MNEIKYLPDEINEFIDLAERNRKYAKNTAIAFKSAFSKFAQILNQEEKQSLELIIERFSRLSAEFHNQYRQNASVDSLKRYLVRVKKLLSDFQSWGLNTQNWSEWKVNTPRLASKKNNELATKSEIKDDAPAIVPQPNNKTNDEHSNAIYPNVQSAQFKIPLRPGISAYISTPENIKKSEVFKIKKYIEYLDSIAEND